MKMARTRKNKSKPGEAYQQADTQKLLNDIENVIKIILNNPNNQLSFLLKLFYSSILIFFLIKKEFEK